MNGVCSTQNVFVCRKHKPTVEGSFFGKTGNLVAAEHAGCWLQSQASQNLGTEPLFGTSSLCHRSALSDQVLLLTNGLGVSRISDKGYSFEASWQGLQLQLDDFPCPHTLTEGFETLKSCSWEQKLTVFYFCPNHPWPGNQRGSCDTKKTRLSKPIPLSGN